MKFTRTFLVGGTVEDPQTAGMPAEGGAPVEQGAPAGGDPELALIQLAQLAAQALQNQDCEAAMATCQGFLELVQGMQGGAPQEEPIYRKGGRLVRRVSRD